MTFETQSIGDCTLYRADAMDVLPTLTADHIISDPPYEDELHAAVGRFGGLRSDGKSYASNKLETFGFDGVNDVRTEIAKLCVDASQGWLILFALAEGVRAWRDDIQAAGAKYDTCCAWVKPDSAPRFNGQGPARGFECFVTAWCAGGYRFWNAGGKRGVYTHLVNPPTRHGAHPTEKPIKLMQELLIDFTNYGELICDPFMGSGTTGVACVNLGRKFIGIEREAKYFDISCRRIEQAYAQPRLFEEPAPKAVQEVMEL